MEAGVPVPGSWSTQAWASVMMRVRPLGTSKPFAPDCQVQTPFSRIPTSVVTLPVERSERVLRSTATRLAAGTPRCVSGWDRAQVGEAINRMAMASGLNIGAPEKRGVGWNRFRCGLLEAVGPDVGARTVGLVPHGLRLAIDADGDLGLIGITRVVGLDECGRAPAAAGGVAVGPDVVTGAVRLTPHRQGIAAGGEGELGTSGIARVVGLDERRRAPAGASDVAAGPDAVPC